MNLFFWRHSKKDKPVLIKKSCYDKLPKHYQEEFIQHDVLEDDSTHHVMDVNGDFQLYNTLGIGSISLGDRIANEGELPDTNQNDLQQAQFGEGTAEGASAGNSYTIIDDSLQSADVPQIEIPQQDNCQAPDQVNSSDSTDMSMNASMDNVN